MIQGAGIESAARSLVLNETRIRGRGHNGLWSIQEYLSQKYSLGTFLDKFVHNLIDLLTKREN